MTYHYIHISFFWAPSFSSIHSRSQAYLLGISVVFIDACKIPWSELKPHQEQQITTQPHKFGQSLQLGYKYLQIHGGIPFKPINLKYVYRHLDLHVSSPATNKPDISHHQPFQKSKESKARNRSCNFQARMVCKPAKLSEKEL